MKTSGVDACPGAPDTRTNTPNAECPVTERTTNLQVFSLCAPFRCVHYSLGLCRASKKRTMPVLRYILRPH